MDLITFDDHLGVRYTSQIEHFTHIINHIGIDKLFIGHIKYNTLANMIGSFYNLLPSYQIYPAVFGGDSQNPRIHNSTKHQVK